MKLYPLFLVVAATTVLTPGPGVVMTLTNSLRYRFRDTLAGILGIAGGTLVVATLSATGLGLVLATSAAAFRVAQYAGAAYLVFLGIRLWNAPPPEPVAGDARAGGASALFARGVTLQITNPKALVFFLSVLPQFVDDSPARSSQLAVLVLTYGSLVVVIHSAYAIGARHLKAWLASATGWRMVHRVGGALFVGFGVSLAAARR